MQADIDAPPAAADVVEQLAELSGLAHVQRQDDVGLELLRDRTDVGLGFLVLESDGEVGTLCPERLGAAEGDGVLFGDAKHKSLLAGEREHEVPLMQ
jgi:hypothetical protein